MDRVVKQRNFEEKFVTGKIEIKENMKNNNFFQNLPLEIVAMIVSLLPSDGKLQLMSCSKEFHSGDLGRYFYQNAQNATEAFIKQCVLREIQHIFLNHTQLNLETLCQKLDDYIRKNRAWLTSENNFVIQKYYFLTYFFKHVLMNNECINYANKKGHTNYSNDNIEKKDFENLVFLVYTILKDSCPCSFDTKYFNTQYYFKLYDYSIDIPYIHNPWCVIIDYGKNNNLKTMALFYQYSQWENSKQMLTLIHEELHNGIKKEKSFIKTPTDINRHNTHFSFDGIYGPYLQKYLKEYLDTTPEEDQSEFEELLESLQKNDTQQISLHWVNAQPLSDHQYARLYNYFYHNHNSKDSCIGIINNLSVALRSKIIRNHKPSSNIIPCSTLRLAIIYNMRNGLMQYYEARDGIQSTLNKVGKELIKHLYITTITCEYYPLPSNQDYMYQSGHIFTKDEFPRLLPENTHIIMNR